MAAGPMIVLALTLAAMFMLERYYSSLAKREITFNQLINDLLPEDKVPPTLRVPRRSSGWKHCVHADKEAGDRK